MLKFNNPFKRAGFDSIVSDKFVFDGAIIVPEGTTLIMDGFMNGPSISSMTSNPTDGTTLVVGGDVQVDHVIISNVTVTGELKCKKLIVEGMLAIKAGAKVTAEEIQYRNLTIEDGAIVLGQMNHLDHISAGEQT
jgi:cytoskeletal protein CcmA (bactofilin family)